MNRNLAFAVVGVVLAITLTASMDATGFSDFSALPLFGLIAIFWIGQRHSRQSIGLQLGKPSHYLMAAAYPVVVMALLIALATAASEVDFSGADWKKVGLNVVLSSTMGVIIGLITEEGFFRGWLWATLSRAKLQEKHILVWTSLAFMLWHISVVTMETGFELPTREIPVYLVNVLLLGAVWGQLRALSGSIVVASFSHAVWNGLAYSLFGFGTKIGELGIQNTATYGPEVGWIAIVLNLGFFMTLRWSCSRTSKSSGQTLP